MKIHFIVGCGRCGKTTLARKLADETPGAVLIDEAQFLWGAILFLMVICCRIRGVDLIVSGLKYWADGRLTSTIRTARWLRLFFDVRITRPINPNQFCPCGCGRHPDIDLKTDGDLGQQVEVSRSLYYQVCFEEWEKVMGRRPEGR